MTTPDKKLGLPSIILLGLNTIVGSGIFLLPGQVSSLVGPWSPYVYFLAAAIIISIAWCYAKCSRLFNRDGGVYLYARHAFGDFIGFEVGILRWIGGMLSWAALAVGFVTALSSIWPAAILEPNRSIIIFLLIGILGGINTLNLGVLKFCNNFLSIAKIVPLLFFAGASIFFIKQSNLMVPLPAIESHSIGAAILLIFFAFSGFESLVVPAGEMKNPEKNLPIAVMSTILICSFLYFVIQVIALGTLGTGLSSSVSPISDVAEMFLGPPGKIAITIIMLISISGVNLAASFIVPKMGAALAQDKMLPDFISKKNQFGSSYVAVMITMFFTILMASSGDFVQLAAVASVSRFSQHIATSLAVFVFYKDRLSFKQPLSKSLTMLIPILSLSGIVWLMSQSTFGQMIYLPLVLSLTVPLYFIFRSRRLSVSTN